MTTLAELIRQSKRPEMEHTGAPRIDTSRASASLSALANTANRAGESMASYLPRMGEKGSLGYDEDGNLVGYQPESAQLQSLVNWLGPDALGAALSQLAPGMLRAIGVWHGSPHKFDKFDMGKIGTGEGAQAYGHGLYFAESPDVAEGYRKSLSTGQAKAYLDGMEDKNIPIQSYHQTLDDLAADLERSIRGYTALADQRQNPANKQAMLNFAETARQQLGALRDGRVTIDPGGAIYKTSLQWPDPAREAADPLGPHHFLDWDLPLSEQSEYIQRQLGGEFADNILPSHLVRSISPDDPLGGRAVYSAIQGRHPSAASNALRWQGIPGIRYLDQGSRGTGEGTRNYVVFDDSIAKILERNGIPVK